jgi:hypothetical protein
MTTRQATRLYNKAEKQLDAINAKRCFIDKAIDINDLLEFLYGEETADEIIDMVFENEGR